MPGLFDNLPPELLDYIRGAQGAQPPPEFDEAMAKDAEARRNAATVNVFSRAAALIRNQPGAAPPIKVDTDSGMRDWVMRQKAKEGARADYLAPLDVLGKYASATRKAAPDPLVGLKGQKLEAEIEKLRGGATPDVLEPELIERAGKVKVPTEKRKREAVIADILAAEKSAADRGVASDREKATADAKAQADRAKDLDDLRKEFQGLPIYRDAVQVATSFDKVQNTSDSGAGDMSLIFGYMKILDPGSTVREGEYATAESVGSVPQRIWTQYNKAVAGERLSPEVRRSFKEEAKRIYDGQMVRFRKAASEFGRIATERGHKPGDVVLDLGMDKPSTIRVRRKADGQTGTMPADKFNPDLYEKIE